MSSADSERPIKSVCAVAIWSVMLIGTFVQFRFVFKGGAILTAPSVFDIVVPAQFEALLLFALFDLFVPIIAVWGVLRGWFRPPSRRLLLWISAFVAAVVVHTTLYHVFSSGLNGAWLVKESAKLISLAVLFLCLLVIFQSRDLRSPPKPVVAAVLVGAIPTVVLLSHFDPIFIARTVYAVTLAGLVFLLGQDGGWRRSPYERFWLTLAGLAVAAAAILLHNKGVAGMMLAMTTWVVLANFLVGATASRIVVISGVLLLVFIGGAILSGLAGLHVDLLKNMATLERSIDVRIDLWGLALEKIRATFPIGLGLGQFPEAIKTVPELALEEHRFVHNSFLGLITDLGLLGIAFAVGLGLILALAAKGWSAIVAPMFLVVVLPPLLIHDGHSIRMLLVVTALGLARYLYGSKDVARSRGP